MSYIVADRLIKHYGKGEAAVSALSEVSVEIAAGEFIGIMGASGSGKSTLLSILGAMNTPSSGTLRVDGIDVYGLTREQRADFRREFLGFVFQSGHLLPYLTVLENTLLPLTVVKADKQSKRRMATEALRQVGLEGKHDRLPGQISGGEAERVAIARAIVNEPPVLLADEPTGNLDSRTSREIMELLQRLNQDGMTIVMVTHSAQCAGSAKRILHMSDGRLLAN
jgi:putative ABC transport system ATP-binding protein